MDEARDLCVGYKKEVLKGRVWRNRMGAQRSVGLRADTQ